MSKRIENFRNKYPLEFNSLVDVFHQNKLNPMNWIDTGIILIRNSYIPKYTVSILASKDINLLDFDIWCNLAPKEGFIRNEKPYNRYSFKIRPDWTVVWTSDGIGGMERYGNDPFFTDVMNVLIKLGIFSKDLKLIKDDTLPALKK